MVSIPDMFDVASNVFVFSTSCLLEGFSSPFPVEPGLLTKLVAASAWLCVTLSIFVNEYRDVSLVET